MTLLIYIVLFGIGFAIGYFLGSRKAHKEIIFGWTVEQPTKKKG